VLSHLNTVVTDKASAVYLVATLTWFTHRRSDATDETLRT
jgi:hypothetical protein